MSRSLWNPVAELSAKDAEIADLKRQLEEARKDTERLMSALDNAKAAIKEALSEIVTGCDCDYCNILRNASEAIDAAREGR